MLENYAHEFSERVIMPMDIIVLLLILLLYIIRKSRLRQNNNSPEQDRLERREGGRDRVQGHDSNPFKSRLIRDQITELVFREVGWGL